jgi:hypothetical protein
MPNIVSCWPLDEAPCLVEHSVARFNHVDDFWRGAVLRLADHLLSLGLRVFDLAARFVTVALARDGGNGCLALQVVDDGGEPGVAPDEHVQHVLGFGQAVVVPEAAPKLLNDWLAAEHRIELEEDRDRRGIEPFARFADLDKDVVAAGVEIAQPLFRLRRRQIVAAVDYGAAQPRVVAGEDPRQVVGVGRGCGEDQPLVLPRREGALPLERPGKFAHERLNIIIIPAELLTDAALVEVGQFGHLRGGEGIDFAVGAPEFDGVVLHLHRQPFEDAPLPPRLAHGHVDQGVDDEPLTVLGRDIAGAGQRFAVETDRRRGKEHGGCNRERAERRSPLSALAEVVGFIADEVHAPPGAEPGIPLGRGSDLLVGRHDHVGTVGRGAVECGVFGQVLADVEARVQDLQSPLEAVVHLRAENVGRREVEAGIGVAPGSRDGERADADDCLSITDGHNDELGAGAGGKRLGPSLKREALAGTEARVNDVHHARAERRSACMWISLRPLAVGISRCRRDIS